MQNNVRSKPSFEQARTSRRCRQDNIVRFPDVIVTRCPPLCQHHCRRTNEREPLYARPPSPPSNKRARAGRQCCQDIVVRPATVVLAYRVRESRPTTMPCKLRCRSRRRAPSSRAVISVAFVFARESPRCRPGTVVLSVTQREPMSTCAATAVVLASKRELTSTRAATVQILAVK